MKQKHRETLEDIYNLLNSRGVNVEGLTLETIDSLLKKLEAKAGV